MEASGALGHLINVYSRSFHGDFQVEMPQSPLSSSDSTNSHLTFHLYAAHNLPEIWERRICNFSISCSVIYAGRKLYPEIKSRNGNATKSLFSRVIWDEVITFPIPLCSLPLETMLVLRLCGQKEGSSDKINLAWSCLPLYSQRKSAHGTILLNMISHAEPPPVITPRAFDTNLPTLVTVQVRFPETTHIFIQPEPGQSSVAVPTEDPSAVLEGLVNRNSILLLSDADKHFLWSYRHCPNKPRNLLPLVLGSAPGWDPSSISDMYGILREGMFSGPLEALALLNSCFSDRNIRNVACQQIENLSNDNMLDVLPQMVQAVKFEWDLDSPLVRLLLHRSLQSIQFAHRLFWLLSDARNKSHYRGLFHTLLGTLQFCVGKALNEEFSKQENLLSILRDIAEKGKNAPEAKRQETLQSNLHKLERFFQKVRSCRLPLDPAIVVKGVDPSACSFFKSNASPLKISFLNSDPMGKETNVIYKVGDDLRQDMLVLQIIGIIDRIWLHEGLDMEMVTYKCLSTGKKQGLIEMVPNATTLAKIHSQSGILGPLNERSIKKWFRRNHPLPCDYEKATENFLFSCAGWCVVTFILGVCDRHNDNIMVTDEGRMFHIDFGKFLGHAQKFGNIKRDRTPFIFTTEMEYFITEGGKNLIRAQQFVELCCRAYNLIRRHSHLLVNMVELMLQAGIPELYDVEDLRYLHNNLRPQDSDPEATSYFTRKIEESLQCFPVKLNNMIHILANTSLSEMAKSITSVDPASPKSFIKKAAIAGIRKINEKSEKILTYFGEDRHRVSPSIGDPDPRPRVQLQMSFKNQTLSVLIKHLRNVHLSDGSSPSADIEVSLLPDPYQSPARKIRSKGKSTSPIYNEIVTFYVSHLAQHIVKLVVKSKGEFVASVNIPVDRVDLDKDVWYPLGLSMA